MSNERLPPGPGPRARTLLGVCAGVLLGFMLALSFQVSAGREPSGLALPWDDARLLADVLERVRRDYVDEVDERELMRRAVRGMVASLDSHSTLLEPTEYEGVRINTTGAYSGVGLEIEAADGRLRVVEPVEGSPAERAGVRPGDWLVAVDDRPVVAADRERVVASLRGRTGSLVKLALERDGRPGRLELELRRGQVHLHTVRHELLDERLGYVRIVHFSDTTLGDLERAVAKLEGAAGGRLAGLVIDLRGNPGGVLEAGVAVADAFLERGVIVSASGRAPDARFTMRAAPGDISHGAKLVLLVDGGSASASEIVAGALRDHRRATLVGRTTYGKGSVQTVMPLPGGRALKITTSRYYTPSGASLDDTGLKPDVPLPKDAVRVETASLGAGIAARDPEVKAALAVLRGEPARDELVARAPAARLPAVELATATPAAGGAVDPATPAAPPAPRTPAR